MNSSKNDVIIGDGISIAQKDKMIMNLQELKHCKKTQLKEDYKRLKASVGDNPYLQTAIDSYEDYFKAEKQQLKALKSLLKQVGSMDNDRKLIQKEIAILEKNSL